MWLLKVSSGCYEGSLVEGKLLYLQSAFLSYITGVLFSVLSSLQVMGTSVWVREGPEVHFRVRRYPCVYEEIVYILYAENGLSGLLQVFLQLINLHSCLFLYTVHHVIQ